MDVYVDATMLIALGRVGELELLTNFDGQVALTSGVVDEVAMEPASSTLDRLRRHDDVRVRPTSAFGADVDEAQEILGESEVNGDVEIIAGILTFLGPEATTGQNDVPLRDSNVAVVSDDRRVRTVAESLGTTVTGTIGVVVRAVHEGMNPDEAKELVRRLDSQGLHMTGELRETAYRLIDEAAKESEE